jgi:propanediol dehydratase small subunit
MNPLLTLLFVAVVLTVTWSLKFGGRLPRAFRERTCQGRGWRRAFPDASKSEIRTFLSLFVSSFAFDENGKLKLSPADQVMQVYRALYPYKWQADALEVETLALELKKQYGLEMAAIWKEGVTLGDIFAHATRAKAQSAKSAATKPIEARHRS